MDEAIILEYYKMVLVVLRSSYPALADWRQISLPAAAAAAEGNGRPAIVAFFEDVSVCRQRLGIRACASLTSHYFYLHCLHVFELPCPADTSTFPAARPTQTNTKMKFFLASLLMAGAIHADGIRADADDAGDGPVLRTSGPTSLEEHAADDEGKTEGYADLVTKPGSIGSGSIGECVFHDECHRIPSGTTGRAAGIPASSLGTKRAQATRDAAKAEFFNFGLGWSAGTAVCKPARPLELKICRAAT